MANKTAELGGINLAIDRQQKIVKELEDRLFLEQLRLAALNAARERALRQTMLSDNQEAADDG